jgi:uncharacterized membrane-anchored protein YhcB (DUF1043 family)
MSQVELQKKIITMYDEDYKEIVLEFALSAEDVAKLDYIMEEMVKMQDGLEYYQDFYQSHFAQFCFTN